MKSAQVDTLALSDTEPQRIGLTLNALATLFVLTLRQHLRGRRLIVLCFLFTMPSVLAVIIKFVPHPPPPGHLEFALVLNLLPSALATLTVLLYASGIVLDEVEEQTLTYLLLRPLPRWALYLTKFFATVGVTSVLTGAFTMLTMTVIYWNAPDEWREAILDRAPKTVALLAVAQVGYCSLFGAIGFLTRWVLIAGIGYIIVFEGLLANLEFMTRKLTVMYYFRVLAMHWFDPPDSKIWSIDMAKAPSAASCMETLLIVSLILMLFGAWRMVRGEFRMKTPEGS